MIPGGESTPKRCARPELHRRHRWVSHPTSRLDWDCDGKLADDGQEILDLQLTA